MNQLQGIFKDQETGQKCAVIFFPFNKQIGEKKEDSCAVTIPVLMDDLINISKETLSGCWLTADFEKRFSRIQ